MNPSQKIDANIDATALNTLSPTKPIEPNDWQQNLQL